MLANTYTLWGCGVCVGWVGRKERRVTTVSGQIRVESSWCLLLSDRIKHANRMFDRHTLRVDCKHLACDTMHGPSG